MSPSFLTNLALLAALAVLKFIGYMDAGGNFFLTHYIPLSAGALPALSAGVRAAACRSYARMKGVNSPY